MYYVFIFFVYDYYLGLLPNIQIHRENSNRKNYDYYDYYLLHHKQNTKQPKKRDPLIIGMKYAI